MASEAVCRYARHVASILLLWGCAVAASVTGTPVGTSRQRMTGFAGLIASAAAVAKGFSDGVNSADTYQAALQGFSARRLRSLQVGVHSA